MLYPLNGKFALSRSNDTLAKVWNLTTGEVVSSFNEHTDAVGRTTFAFDGRCALSISYRSRILRLWNIFDGKEIGTIN